MAVFIRDRFSHDCAGFTGGQRPRGLHRGRREASAAGVTAFLQERLETPTVSFGIRVLLLEISAPLLAIALENTVASALAINCFWLNGVGVAGHQVVVLSGDTIATGLNSSGSAFYHGALAGIHFNW